MNIEDIRKTLSSSDMELSRYQIHRVKSAHSNSVYRLSDELSPESPIYYLKDYSLIHNGTERALTEIATVNLLRERTKLPVKEAYLLVDSTTNTICLLLKELPGIPLIEILYSSDNTRIQLLIEQSAQILAQVHQVTSDSYGGVNRALGQRYSTWKACFTDNIHTKLDFAKKKNIIGLSHVDFFEKRLKSQIFDGREHPTLIHGDFEPRNLLVDPITLTITGLLDFESSRFWQPEWDLTRISAISFPERPDLVDLFVNYYASITKSNLDELNERIDFFRVFESLHYWVWGWGQNQDLTEYIQKDVARVTGIAAS